ncbi:hypothetical protein QBC38DRAFT_514071 [Podospora fimiseda]|uniref:Glycosyltransferase n=1 Tax=Podospora fimiseda TaxID=252190 RepID=A0AAN7BZG9_9PEZI|nr:hypothetical protein QBC38DRAFT_514071 [Podospora fimiseda]
MIVRNALRLCILCYMAFILYLFAPKLYYLFDRLRQTNPWSGQKWIEQIWIPTDAELRCLNGTAQLPNKTSSSSSSPIPNIVHFNFGLKNPLYDSKNPQFDFLNYLAIRSALISLSPDALYLHYTYLSSPPSADPYSSPKTNPWIRRLTRQGVTLVHHPPPSTPPPPQNPTSPKQHRQHLQYPHLSDTLRLNILLTLGGIYLDIDAFALRPFTSLLHNPHPTILGHEGGNRFGLCNAVIISRPNSSFLSRWLSSYSHADLSKEWNYHSVRLPKILADENPDEVCTLAPDAFFWPTWTWRHIEWMHSLLDRQKTKEWKDTIERNEGSLFKNQLAYHSWNQLAWDRYLSKLTPEIVRTKNTRFNLLMRRFLEDDI